MMSENRPQDEQILIDFLLDQLDEDQANSVRKRLEQEESFRTLHEDTRRALGALDLLPQVDPPEDLVDRTMARIRSAQQTEQILARESLGARRTFWPTFSWREVSAVAAVALLLVAFFVPSMQQARRRAIDNECAQQAGQIGYGLLTYANRNNDYLPAPDASTDAWLPGGDRQVASTSEPLFKLVSDKYASPVLFQCPSVGGESFVVKAGMDDFPAGKFISYSYQYNLGRRPVRRNDPDVLPHAKDLVVLADDNPVFEGGVFHADRLDHPVSRNHDARGQNALYLDGHVAWGASPNLGVANNNIYLVDGVDSYDGTEKPRDKTDSFLLPAFSGGR